MRDGVSGENNAHAAKEQAEQTIQAANEEIAKVQAHYENEMSQIKRERVELVHKIQDLVSQNERLKVDGSRQLNHFKTKYSEYKQKLRKANQNIATLLARIAKYDIQMSAERNEDDIGDGPQMMRNYGIPDDQNLQQILAAAGIDGGQINLQDLMANDGLNDEIKKLLADA